MNLDTSTPAGKLMLNLMGSFAEFEREIMLERQREPRGISTLGETAQAKIPE
jgi:DNA invertase Pin-like site-specific DNA recombinase